MLLLPAYDVKAQGTLAKCQGFMVGSTEIQNLNGRMARKKARWPGELG